MGYTDDTAYEEQTKNTKVQTTENYILVKTVEEEATDG